MFFETSQTQSTFQMIVKVFKYVIIDAFTIGIQDFMDEKLKSVQIESRDTW